MVSLIGSNLLHEEEGEQKFYAPLQFLGRDARVCLTNKKMMVSGEKYNCHVTKNLVEWRAQSTERGFEIDNAREHRACRRDAASNPHYYLVTRNINIIIIIIMSRRDR